MQHPELDQTKYQISLSSCNDVLQNCQNYLIFEEKPIGSIKLFNTLLEEGKKGIIITRSHPDKLVTNLRNGNPEKVDLWWLSSEDFNYVIHPWETHLMLNKIKEFLKQNPNGVILFNGLEYLSTYNESNHILNLIFNIIKIVDESKSKFLITMDPLALDNRFLFNIETNSEITYIPSKILKEVLN
jgi:hypothetical protein